MSKIKKRAAIIFYVILFSILLADGIMVFYYIKQSPENIVTYEVEKLYSTDIWEVQQLEKYLMFNKSFNWMLFERG